MSDFYTNIFREIADAQPALQGDPRYPEHPNNPAAYITDTDGNPIGDRVFEAGASFTLVFDIAGFETGAEPWTPLAFAQAKAKREHCVSELSRRGFGSFEAAHADDVRIWRENFAAVVPPLPTARFRWDIGTPADRRRRHVRSTVDLLYAELERTCQQLDKCVACGCCHCMLVKLPKLSHYAQQESKQIDYWLDWDHRGGYR